MEDVSKLVIQVQSDAVVTADARMDHMTQTAARVERATDLMTQSLGEANRIADQIARSVGEARKVMDSMTTSVSKVDKSMVDMAKSAGGAEKATDTLVNTSAEASGNLGELESSLGGAERAAETLVDAAAEASSNMGEMADSTAEVETATQGLVDAAAQAGAGMDSTAAATAGVDAAMGEMAASADDAGSATEGLADSLSEAETNAEELGDTAGKASDEVEDLGDAADDASDNTDDLAESSDRAGKATDGLVGAASRLVARYLSVAAAIVAAKKALDSLVGATVESEQLQAKLRATTGVTKAEAYEMFLALDQLEGKFATPIEELTEAYSLLASRGLNASSEALESYANVAAGTGSTIGEVSQAIVQASNGMFRGLNQLGIKATQEMDGVAVTFRGTTTKIKGDAASIEQYMQQLSRDKFLGAAAIQADQLGGSIFRLKDAWGDMWRAVSENGAGELIARGVTMATDAIRELTDMIASGQIEGYIDAIIVKWDSFGSAFADMVGFMKTAWSDTMTFFGTSGDDAVGFLTSAFTELPENVAAVVRAIGASLGLIVEYAIAVGKGAYDTVVGQFRYMWETVKNIGDAIWESVKNPTRGGEILTSFLDAQKQSIDNYITGTRTAITATIDQLGFATDAWGEEVTAIMNERDASVAGFKDKIAAADELRRKYDEVKAARDNSAEDPLKKGIQTRGTDTASESQRSQFEALKASLQLEERSITDSYNRRRALILTMTKEGSAERADLEKRLLDETTSAYEDANAQRLDNVIQLEEQLREAEAEGNIAKMASLSAQLSREESAMEESFEYRRKLILDDTTLTEEMRQAKMLELTTKYTDMQRRIEDARNKATLAKASDFFGNLSTIATAFGAKGTRIAKAAAITQTLIDTYRSATGAYASLVNTPYIGPALATAAAAAAVAAGLANVAQIRSQNYTGAYATGGSIPAGGWGIVGEEGPEAVFGPAIITSARASADRGVGQVAPQKQTIITVHNYSGVEAVATERENNDSRLVDIIIKRTKAELTGEIDQGGSPFARTMEKRYNLNRGSAR